MSNSAAWLAEKLGMNPVVAGIPLQPRPVYQQQPVQSQVYQHASAQAATDLLDPEVGPTFSDALRRTDIKGPAAKLEGHLSCPSCGSGTSYTQYSGAGANRPRPHCFECGYNGYFTQGDQANWAV